MTYNVIIPCSGPGTRSQKYSKFHKALIRVGDRAVLSHIIDSYPNADTIYIMLGHNETYVRQYIELCQYENIEFIDIDNWAESQYESLRQLPDYVFDQPFYLNSCDNWSPVIPEVNNNTAFFCTPPSSEYYDTVNGKAFAGIGFVKDTHDWQSALHKLTATRNDYLIHSELTHLDHYTLSTWYDVGNIDSFMHVQSQFNDEFDLLDKTKQEIYYVDKRVIKLFKKPIGKLSDRLVNNQTFPHPGAIQFTEHGLSYDFVDGRTNVVGDDFDKLLNNLTKLWEYCLGNNNNLTSTSIWQEKTYKRFGDMINMYPEFSQPVQINGVMIDPSSVIEKVDWKLLTSGIGGQCHGDLNLDNIILTDDTICYIDHRATVVTDIFYDICKFYHGLHLNNQTIKQFRFEGKDSKYNVSIDLKCPERLTKFKDTSIYQDYKRKIEMGTGCIWLCMAPLNVSDDLNKFLFLYAIEHLFNVI